MKSFYFPILLAFFVTSHVHAEDIEVSISVPPPPDAWEVTGIGASLFGEAGTSGEAQFSWGDISGQSDLLFSSALSPLAPIPPETSDLSVLFSMGSLEFSNGGFPISTADLSLMLTLDQGLDSDEIALDANFSFTSLPGEIELSFASQSNTSPQPLLFNDKFYTLEILGFSETDVPEFEIMSSFTVPYDGVSPGVDSRFLIARLTLSVPEPHTYLLIGTLCTIVVGAKRRLRKT